MFKPIGTVFIAGAGPGNPELITVRPHAPARGRRLVSMPAKFKCTKG